MLGLGSRRCEEQFSFNAAAAIEQSGVWHSANAFLSLYPSNAEKLDFGWHHVNGGFINIYLRQGLLCRDHRTSF